MRLVFLLGLLILGLSRPVISQVDPNNPNNDQNGGQDGGQNGNQQPDQGNQNKQPDAIGPPQHPPPPPPERPLEVNVQVNNPQDNSEKNQPVVRPKVFDTNKKDGKGKKNKGKAPEPPVQSENGQLDPEPETKPFPKFTDKLSASLENLYFKNDGKKKFKMEDILQYDLTKYEHYRPSPKHVLIEGRFSATGAMFFKYKNTESGKHKEVMVWTPTDEEVIFYKNNKGKHVPRPLELQDAFKPQRSKEDIAASQRRKLYNNMHYYGHGLFAAGVDTTKYTLKNQPRTNSFVDSLFSQRINPNYNLDHQPYTNMPAGYMPRPDQGLFVFDKGIIPNPNRLKSVKNPLKRIGRNVFGMSFWRYDDKEKQRMFDPTTPVTTEINIVPIDQTITDKITVSRAIPTDSDTIPGSIWLATPFGDMLLGQQSSFAIDPLTKLNLESLNVKREFTNMECLRNVLAFQANAYYQHQKALMASGKRLLTMYHGAKTLNKPGTWPTPNDPEGTGLNRQILLELKRYHYIKKKLEVMKKNFGMKLSDDNTHIIVESSSKLFEVIVNPNHFDYDVKLRIMLKSMRNIKATSQFKSNKDVDIKNDMIVDGDEIFGYLNKKEGRRTGIDLTYPNKVQKAYFPGKHSYSQNSRYVQKMIKDKKNMFVYGSNTFELKENTDNNYFQLKILDVDKILDSNELKAIEKISDDLIENVERNPEAKGKKDSKKGKKLSNSELQNLPPYDPTTWDYQKYMKIQYRIERIEKENFENEQKWEKARQREQKIDTVVKTGLKKVQNFFGFGKDKKDKSKKDKSGSRSPSPVLSFIDTDPLEKVSLSLERKSMALMQNDPERERQLQMHNQQVREAKQWDREEKMRARGIDVERIRELQEEHNRKKMHQQSQPQPQPQLQPQDQDQIRNFPVPPPQDQESEYVPMAESVYSEIGDPENPNHQTREEYKQDLLSRQSIIKTIEVTKEILNTPQVLKVESSQDFNIQGHNVHASVEHIPESVIVVPRLQDLDIPQDALLQKSEEYDVPQKPVKSVKSSVLSLFSRKGEQVDINKDKSGRSGKTGFGVRTHSYRGPKKSIGRRHNKEEKNTPPLLVVPKFSKPIQGFGKARSQLPVAPPPPRQEQDLTFMDPFPAMTRQDTPGQSPVQSRAPSPVQGPILIPQDSAQVDTQDVQDHQRPSTPILTNTGIIHLQVGHRRQYYKSDSDSDDEQDKPMTIQGACGGPGDRKKRSLGKSCVLKEKKAKFVVIDDNSKHTYLMGMLYERFPGLMSTYWEIDNEGNRQVKLDHYKQQLVLKTALAPWLNQPHKDKGKNEYSLDDLALFTKKTLQGFTEFPVTGSVDIDRIIDYMKHNYKKIPDIVYIPVDRNTDDLRYSSNLFEQGRKVSSQTQPGEDGPNKFDQRNPYFKDLKREKNDEGPNFPMIKGLEWQKTMAKMTQKRFGKFMVRLGIQKSFKELGPEIAATLVQMQQHVQMRGQCIRDRCWTQRQNVDSYKYEVMRGLTEDLGDLMMDSAGMFQADSKVFIAARTLGIITQRVIANGVLKYFAQDSKPDISPEKIQDKFSDGLIQCLNPNQMYKIDLGSNAVDSTLQRLSHLDYSGARVIIGCKNLGSLRIISGNPIINENPNTKLHEDNVYREFDLDIDSIKDLVIVSCTNSNTTLTLRTISQLSDFKVQLDKTHNTNWTIDPEFCNKNPMDQIRVHESCGLDLKQQYIETLIPCKTLLMNGPTLIQDQMNNIFRMEKNITEQPKQNVIDLGKDLNLIKFCDRLENNICYSKIYKDNFLLGNDILLYVPDKIHVILDCMDNLMNPSPWRNKSIIMDQTQIVIEYGKDPLTCGQVNIQAKINPGQRLNILHSKLQTDFQEESPNSYTFDITFNVPKTDPRFTDPINLRFEKIRFYIDIGLTSNILWTFTQDRMSYRIKFKNAYDLTATINPDTLSVRVHGRFHPMSWGIKSWNPAFIKGVHWFDQKLCPYPHKINNDLGSIFLGKKTWCTDKNLNEAQIRKYIPFQVGLGVPRINSRIQVPINNDPGLQNVWTLKKILYEEINNKNLDMYWKDPLTLTWTNVDDIMSLEMRDSLKERVMTRFQNEIRMDCTNINDILSVSSIDEIDQDQILTRLQECQSV